MRASGVRDVLIYCRNHKCFCSIGLAVGEGLDYRFLAMNDSGSIEEWHEKVDGEWQVVTRTAAGSSTQLGGREMRRRALAAW
jgi:hypothetical protein